MKGRGNPWHDARGRFCSGPRNGGYVSAKALSDIEIPEGVSVSVKNATGESDPFDYVGKESTLRTEDGRIVVGREGYYLNDETGKPEKKYVETKSGLSPAEFREMITLQRECFDNNEAYGYGDCLDLNAESKHFDNTFEFYITEDKKEGKATITSARKNGIAFSDENEEITGMIVEKNGAFRVTMESDECVEDRFYIEEGDSEYDTFKRWFRMKDLMVKFEESDK